LGKRKKTRIVPSDRAERRKLWITVGGVEMPHWGGPHRRKSTVFFRSLEERKEIFFGGEELPQRARTQCPESCRLIVTPKKKGQPHKKLARPLGTKKPQPRNRAGGLAVKNFSPKPPWIEKGSQSPGCGCNGVAT